MPIDAPALAPSESPGSPKTQDEVVKEFVSNLDAKAEADKRAAIGAEGLAPTEGQEAKPDDTKPEAEDSPDVRKARQILIQAQKAEKRALDKSKASERELIQLLKSSPSKFLERTGVTVEQFLEAITNEGQTIEEKPPTAEDRVKKLEDLMAAKERALLEQEVTDLKAAVIEEIKKSDKYPHINRGEEHQQVTDLMVAYYETYKKPMSFEEAAAEVEKELAAYAARLSGASIDSKGSKPASNVKPNSLRKASETLTNDQNRGVKPTADSLPMESEARHRAVLKQLGL